MWTIGIVLALATLLVSVSPIGAAAGSAETTRLARQLREAHFARIGVDANTVVLVKPWATSEGLAYESARGYPKTRPAIVVGAGWDTIPPPPNPVPWERIDQIETGVQSRALGIVIGGALGLVGGFYLGAWAMDSRSSHSVIVVGPLLCAAGAGLGALLLPTTSWKQVFPQTMR